MLTSNLADLFALMVFGHMLGDYPLQGAFLSRAKNRSDPLPGTPWYQALAAHAIIQGGIVGIITGSLVLALLETVIHALIDDAKCRNKIGFNLDQLLHILCKLLWIGLLVIWT
ncbi:DUF3307 domain-containing protein [Paracoccus aminophilus]|uniref:DUF3307 domain-containing protein n=1 Tax=Paracoccus aminophilus JCM 7686 TaxID=1367847 RepID=S5Z159_PARAH|nr:DUF3307 domain-containing protein [Paracoccus aminophilus]AGT11166.1 hypothetical protein JCM7686_pAMI5p100 [Paracoccus aminophilus JCM 7686]